MGRKKKLNPLIINQHRIRYITRCTFYINGMCQMRSSKDENQTPTMCNQKCDRMRIYDDKNERYKKNQEKKRAKELKEKQENYNNNEEIRCK